MRFGTFGNPGRNGCSVRTISYTSDHTTDDELDETADIASGISRTKGAHRDDSSNDHNNGAHKHDPSTAHTLAKEIGEKGTQEATNFITGGHSTLDGTGMHIVDIMLISLSRRRVSVKPA